MFASYSLTATINSLTLHALFRLPPSFIVKIQDSEVFTLSSNLRNSGLRI